MRRIRILLLAGAGALALAGLAGGTVGVAKLKVQPPMIARDGTITIKGTGFRPRVKVTLAIARPRSDNTSRIGSVKAKANGRFTFAKAIPRVIDAGSWVVLACQAGCRTKATAPFRVAKVQPV